MKKIRNQIGFTLIETMLVMGIAAVSLFAYAKYQLLTTQKNQAISVGVQAKMIGAATKSYLAHNLAALDAEVFTLKTVPLTALRTATSCGTTVCLSINILTPTFWGANFTAYIKKSGASSPYLYEVLITTPSPLTINGVTRLDLASHAASTLGDHLVFSVVKSGSAKMVSSNGVELNQSDWTAAIQSVGANPIGGQLGYYFSQVGLPYDSVYLRMDGSNAMRGNLNMGGKGVYGVGYGINNTGITAANSTSATNAIITDGLTVNGTATLAGNTNITSGNLSVTNAGSFGSLNSNGTLNVSGVSTLNSSLNVGGTASVTGNISTDGNVRLTSNAGDVKMTGLLSTHTTDSLKSLAPNLVEVASYIVGDGVSVSPPSCGAGGSPRIFVIPSSAVAPIYAGSVGYIFSAIGPASGPWTVNAKDSAGNPLPGASIALARTFCSF